MERRSRADDGQGLRGSGESSCRDLNQIQTVRTEWKANAVHGGKAHGWRMSRGMGKKFPGENKRRNHGRAETRRVKRMRRKNRWIIATYLLNSDAPLMQKRLRLWVVRFCCQGSLEIYFDVKIHQWQSYHHKQRDWTQKSKIDSRQQCAASNEGVENRKQVKQKTQGRTTYPHGHPNTRLRPT